MNFPKYVLALVLIATLLPVASAQDSPPGESAETIWSIYKATVQRVRTAHHEAVLDMFTTRDGKTTGPAQVGVHGWLDRNTNTFRRDYRTPKTEWNKLVQTPDSYLFFSGEQQHVSRHPGVLDISQAAHRPFDVWLAPLAGAVSLFEGSQWEEAVKYIESGTMSIDATATAGTTRLLFNPKAEEPVQIRITFDRSKSMVPVEFIEAPIEENGPNWDKPYNQATCVWEDRDEGVFVPVSVDARTTWRSGSRRATVTVKWKSVNEPLPASTFTVEGLELKAGTYVVDQTLGPPIVEDIVGVDVPESVLRSNRDAALVIHPEPSNRGRLVLLGVGGLLLVLLVIGMTRRAATRRSD